MMRVSRAGVVAVVLCVLSLRAWALAPLFHEIDVRLTPANGALSIEDRITVTGREVLMLDLRAELDVAYLAVNGTPVVVDSRARPLRVTLPDDGKHVVTVRYGGTIAAEQAFVDERGAYLPAHAGWLAGWRERTLGYRLRVSVPAPYSAVATGEMLPDAGDGPAVFTVDSALEPPSLFAGRFVVNEQQRGRTRVMTWFPAAAAPLAQRYLDNAGRYIEMLEARIGAYPHRTFHIVAGPLPVGLGFAGLTYVSERILRLPFMQTRSLAHEIAHCWWGNGVGVDYAGGNWAEGLTTYVADYALAREQSEDAAREMRIGWLRDYAALPTSEDMPVRAFRSKTHDAAQVVGYNKVAFIFHMLERELSTPTFDAGLRQFWDIHQNRVAGWEDLRRAFETAAGRDLDGFFSQWLDRAGAPDVVLAAATAQSGDSGYEVHVTLQQRGPAYNVTLPIRVETQAGVEWLPVTLDGESHAARLRVAARPTRITIDPRHDVFRRLAPGESTPIFRDVTLDPNTRVMLATGGDAEASDSAMNLAQRLLRRAPQSGSLDDAEPVILIGLMPTVMAALELADLEPPPPEIADVGTARAWTVRRREGSSIMVVGADDAAALQAMLRSLPHYRRYGYVVFDGRRAMARGVWPSRGSALDRRLD